MVVIQAGLSAQKLRLKIIREVGEREDDAYCLRPRSLIFLPHKQRVAAKTCQDFCLKGQVPPFHSVFFVRRESLCMTMYEKLGGSSRGR